MSYKTYSIHFLFLRKFLILFFVSISISSFSQDAVIKGVIIDGEENEPLIGGNVILNTGIGAATDFDGKYSITTPAGNYTVKFKYIGYETQTKSITLKAGETRVINLTLSPAADLLDDVVISASKYEQKLGDVPVSMAIIKPALIENKATRDAESVIEQVPGVQINENQVSIRGGSGWSYGAGSRVMVMVDGMPMLAGDANDIKWTAIPLENISQIEVIKGASSVLYGSSALNGVINIRTQYPKDEPITKINLSNGFYMPGFSSQMGIALDGSDSTLIRDDQTWWNSPQGYVQGNFTHLQKLTENDELVLGGSFMKDQGYRFGENDQRARINGGWKHFSKKINGLHYGINLNNNFNKSDIFFLWQNADSALFPLGLLDSATTTISSSSSSRIMIDPYIAYIDSNGRKHNLRTRFFRTDNKNNTNQAATSNYYFGEYQFQKMWDNKLTITTGAMTSYTDVISELYGNHTSTNIAGFIQGDKKWNKFNLSGGMRLEYFKIDSVSTQGKLFNKTDLPFQPVFRLGSTYQPAEYTFFRASYGQGYRFPSIAEKYISTFVGGLTIFPNANIEPEMGWSAELGLKQGFKIGNFKGYIDLSGFVTKYENMMEFVFGMYDFNGTLSNLPTLAQQYYAGLSPAQFIDSLKLNHFGARSSNIENAYIPGFELSVVGQGNIGNVDITTLCGYTYINPTSIDADSAYLATFSNPDFENPELNVLKYRNKHMAKMDIQFDYKKWALGWSIRYTSVMENVDDVLTGEVIIDGIASGAEILPGYGEYRDARMVGDVIFDSRIAYKFNDKSKLSLLMTNLTNREYSNRPGNVQAPRTIMWQFSHTF